MNHPNALSSVAGSGNALPHCFPGRPRIVALHTTGQPCVSRSHLLEGVRRYPSLTGPARLFGPMEQSVPPLPTVGTAGYLSGCSRPSEAIPIPQDMCPGGAIVPVH